MSISRRSWSPVKRHQIEDLIVYGAWGVIFGWAFGLYVFYSFDRWVEDPSLVIRLWEGGMSFHGGLRGDNAFICLPASIDTLSCSG